MIDDLTNKIDTAQDLIKEIDLYHTIYAHAQNEDVARLLAESPMSTVTDSAMPMIYSPKINLIISQHVPRNSIILVGGEKHDRIRVVELERKE